MLIQTQDRCECQTGDGNEFDDCSDGSGAADDGLRGGWEDVGVFGVEFGGWEQIWLTWWSPGRFRHDENEK